MNNVSDNHRWEFNGEVGSFTDQTYSTSIQTRLTGVQATVLPAVIKI